MKKHLILGVLFLFLFFCVLPVSATDLSIVTKYGETYMCGESFAANMVAQPIMYVEITKETELYYFYEEKGKGLVMIQHLVNLGTAEDQDEVMLQIRLKIRNLNTQTMNGISPKSFPLTASLRDMEFLYYPEVVMPFDMADYAALCVYNKYAGHQDLHYQVVKSRYQLYEYNYNISDIQDIGDPFLASNYYIDPLRENDLLLIYRVKPFLFDWKLTFQPTPIEGTSSGFQHVVYDNSSYSSCKLEMVIPSIEVNKTKEIIKY